jgi:osmotically-inducible protein OsmY
MSEPRDVLEAVRSALRSEARIRPTTGPIDLDFDNGELTIAGEVDHIAGKKLALEAAARIAGISRIVDRLRVRPATPMGDGEIRDRVRDALLEETALAACAIRVWVKGCPETVREPPDATGRIDVRVEDGVVTLDGDVAGLGEKRLAGVLAWWVPGSQDVINGIGVTPPEEDSEAAVTDAVRQALEKDPFVNAESISVRTRRGIVTLEGSVPREAERKLAEDDAWYVFGIDKVVNHLAVRP